ncbi:MAG: hypothetical protein M1823_000629 [Watsoniomyces obsoletus]|nr:MAG: hypothetical protein M1823_000629 [Watsoniomyces obsoletus]
MAMLYSPDNYPSQPANPPSPLFVEDDRPEDSSKDAFGPLSNLFEPLRRPDPESFIYEPEPESSFFDMNLLPTDDFLSTNDDAFDMGHALSEHARRDINQDSMTMDGLDYATVFSPWFGSGREEMTPPPLQPPSMGSSPLRRGTDPTLYQPVVGDGIGLGLQASPRMMPSLMMATTFPTSPPLTPSMKMKRNGDDKDEKKQKSLKWKKSQTGSVKSEKKKNKKKSESSGVSKGNKKGNGRRASTPTTPTKETKLIGGGNWLQLPMMVAVDDLPMSPPPSGRAPSDGFPTTTFRVPRMNNNIDRRQMSSSSTAAMSSPSTAFMSPDMTMDDSSPMMSRGGSYQGGNVTSFGQSPTMESNGWSFDQHQHRHHQGFNPEMANSVEDGRPTLPSIIPQRAMSYMNHYFNNPHTHHQRHSLPSDRRRLGQAAQRVMSMSAAVNQHQHQHQHRRRPSHHHPSEMSTTNEGDLSNNLAISGLMISTTTGGSSSSDQGYLQSSPMMSSSPSIGNGLFPALGNTSTGQNMMAMAQYSNLINTDCFCDSEEEEELEEEEDNEDGCYSPKSSPPSPPPPSRFPKSRKNSSSRAQGISHHRRGHQQASESSSSSSGISPASMISAGIHRKQQLRKQRRVSSSRCSMSPDFPNPPPPTGVTTPTMDMNMDYEMGEGSFSTRRIKSLSSSGFPSPNNNHHRHRRSTSAANKSKTRNVKRNSTEGKEKEKGKDTKNNNINFVNFTPQDHARILNGVAPSGSSKTKARRDLEALEKRKRFGFAALRAVEKAGGDVEGLRNEVGINL